MRGLLTHVFKNYFVFLISYTMSQTLSTSLICIKYLIEILQGLKTF